MIKGHILSQHPSPRSLSVPQPVPLFFCASVFFRLPEALVALAPPRPTHTHTQGGPKVRHAGGCSSRNAELTRKSKKRSEVFGVVFLGHAIFFNPVLRKWQASLSHAVSELTNCAQRNDPLRKAKKLSGRFSPPGNKSG